MKRHRSRIAVALLLIGALALIAGELSLGPADARARGKVISGRQASSAPRSDRKATALVRLSATQLARDYAKRRAYSVCTGLTAKARKSLGGADGCARNVRRVAGIKRISKITVKKITFRRSRAWANVAGYLNGDSKHRLVVAFKWEGGRYRLDRSLTTLEGLFG